MARNKWNTFLVPWWYKTCWRVSIYLSPQADESVGYLLPKFPLNLANGRISMLSSCMRHPWGQVYIIANLLFCFLFWRSEESGSSRGGHTLRPHVPHRSQPTLTPRWNGRGVDVTTGRGRDSAPTSETETRVAWVHSSQGTSPPLTGFTTAYLTLEKSMGSKTPGEPTGVGGILKNTVEVYWTETCLIILSQHFLSRFLSFPFNLQCHSTDGHQGFPATPDSLPEFLPPPPALHIMTIFLHPIVWESLTVNLKFQIIFQFWVTLLLV